MGATPSKLKLAPPYYPRLELGAFEEFTLQRAGYKLKLELHDAAAKCPS